jgi:hypothetical protein
LHHPELFKKFQSLVVQVCRYNMTAVYLCQFSDMEEQPHDTALAASMSSLFVRAAAQSLCFNGRVPPFHP